MRPFILVLAGVNGAGKSSVGGTALRSKGLDWFNPDTFTRELQRDQGLTLAEANAAAWEEGRRRLQQAIDTGSPHAFETTLGGRTITDMLARATQTHDVIVWYCGLASLDLHLQRVRERVQSGGHDIDQDKIAERYIASPLNLLRLMPRLAGLNVYDNSAGVAPGQPVPDPVLVLRVVGSRVVYPADAATLAATPQWAKPLVEQALQIQDSPSPGPNTSDTA